MGAGGKPNGRRSPASLSERSDDAAGGLPPDWLVTKPHCQIVPLAYAGEMVVSPGCAVSRARTNLPAGELTCALHASAVPEIVGRLKRSAAADHAVAEYAVANDLQHFGAPAVTAPAPPRLRSPSCAEPPTPSGHGSGAIQ